MMRSGGSVDWWQAADTTATLRTLLPADDQWACRTPECLGSDFLTIALGDSNGCRDQDVVGSCATLSPAGTAWDVLTQVTCYLLRVAGSVDKNHGFGDCSMGLTQRR